MTRALRARPCAPLLAVLLLVALGGAPACGEPGRAGPDGGADGPASPGCESARDCVACGSMEACGWCAASGQCVAGSGAGPAAGGCPAAQWLWSPDMCPGEQDAGPDRPTECAAVEACDLCADLAACGYCTSSARCLPGSAEGPADRAACAPEAWVTQWDRCPP